jgi:hypothetical protein
MFDSLFVHARGDLRHMFTIGVGVALSMSVIAAQAPQPVRIDVQAIGPQVGSRVPEFSAPDQFGRTQTLASIMGPKGAMLVFSRSADW